MEAIGTFSLTKCVHHHSALQMLCAADAALILKVVELISSVFGFLDARNVMTMTAKTRMGSTDRTVSYGKLC